MKQLWICLLGIMALIPLQISAETQHYTLKNGLELVLIQDPHSEVASVRTIVRSGSIHEGRQLGAGLSHYLEHLVSGGTTTKRSESQYTDIVDKLGGASNAYTTYDHTAYYIHTTSKQVTKALDVMHEWLFYNSFTDTEYKREKAVVIKEIERGNASIYRQFHKESQAHFYQYYPLRFPVIGYLEQVKSTTKEQIRDYYKQHYVPSNMVLVVGGNIDIQEIKSYVQTTFGRIPERARPLTPVFNEPPPLQSRERTIEADTTVSYLSLRFPTVRFDDADLYPLDLLAYILGEGTQSILHQRLVEDEKLAYSVSVSSYTPAETNGYFDIVVEHDVSNKAAIMAILEELIQKLKKRDISREEIARAKKKKLSEEILALGSIDSRVSRAALSMLYSHQPYYFDYYAKQFKDVDRDDIRRVAQEYLSMKDSIVTSFVPKGSLDTTVETIANSIKEPVVRTLSNGVRVVLKQDNSVPKIEATVFVLGGVRAETKDMNGVGTLLAQSFGKGTRRVSKEKFQKAFENRGAYYGATLANNTFYATMSCLKEDSDELLPLFYKGVLDLEIDKEDFDEVKRQILKKIRQREDQWRSAAMTKFMNWFYEGHPYGFSKLGELESVQNISYESMMAFHRNQLDPQNMVVTVMGDFDIEAVMTQLERQFDDLEETATVQEVPRIPRHHTSITKKETLKQELGAVLIAYDGVGLKQSKTLVQLDVLDAILSGYRYPGGRLHPRLRGEGLVYEVHAYHVPLMGSGYFLIYALTDKQNVTRVKSIILEEVEKLKKKGVTLKELGQAKAQLRYHYADSVADNNRLSVVSATNLLYYNKWNAHKGKESLLEKVRKRDVQRLAQDLLTSPQIMTFN